MLDLVLLPGPPGQRGEETKQNFIFRLQDPVVQEMAKLYNFADNSVRESILPFFLTWILDSTLNMFAILKQY